MHVGKYAANLTVPMSPQTRLMGGQNSHMCSEEAAKHSLTHFTGHWWQISLSRCPSGPAGKTFQNIFKTSRCLILDSLSMFGIFNTWMHQSIDDSLPKRSAVFIESSSSEICSCRNLWRVTASSVSFFKMCLFDFIFCAEQNKIVWITSVLRWRRKISKPKLMTLMI